MQLVWSTASPKIFNPQSWLFFLMLPFEGNGRSPKSIFINPSITQIVISRISLCWSHVTRLTYLSAHSLSITKWGVKQVWNISPRPWCQSQRGGKWEGTNIIMFFFFFNDRWTSVSGDCRVIMNTMISTDSDTY